MRTVSLAAIIVVLICSPAAAVDCKSARGHDGRYWSWRQIDGKRCWYLGPPGMSKTALSWRVARTKKLAKNIPENIPSAALPRERDKPKPRPKPRPPMDEDQGMSEDAVWPAPPPSDTFAERWHGGR